MSVEWEKLLVDSVVDGTIKELYLRKLPVLKTVDNWKRVEFVGSVDHQMKYAYYKGGLVKLNGKLYFVQEKIINAIREFVKWDANKKITVVKD